jgi:hypothetical protein
MSFSASDTKVVQSEPKPIPTICADQHTRIVHYEHECPLCNVFMLNEQLKDYNLMLEAELRQLQEQHE